MTRCWFLANGGVRRARPIQGEFQLRIVLFTKALEEVLPLAGVCKSVADGEGAQRVIEIYCDFAGAKKQKRACATDPRNNHPPTSCRSSRPPPFLPEAIPNWGRIPSPLRAVSGVKFKPGPGGHSDGRHSPGVAPGGQTAQFQTNAWPANRLLEKACAHSDWICMQAGRRRVIGPVTFHRGICFASYASYRT